MAFAPSSTYFDCGDGSILGSFEEKDYSGLFEFSRNDDEMTGAWDFPHRIWVGGGGICGDQGWRYGQVLKTVVYIAVDEDALGQPVVEKWHIKNHRIYENL